MVSVPFFNQFSHTHTPKKKIVFVFRFDASEYFYLLPSSFFFVRLSQKCIKIFVMMFRKWATWYEGQDKIVRGRDRQKKRNEKSRETIRWGQTKTNNNTQKRTRIKTVNKSRSRKPKDYVRYGKMTLKKEKNRIHPFFFASTQQSLFAPRHPCTTYQPLLHIHVRTYK